MQENSVFFEKVVTRARKAVKTVREHLADLICNFDDEFVQCVSRLAKTEGNILFTGVGKSACVAKKLSVTFASLGMPSFFLHPADMGHGDLGNITSRDILVAVSYSGETPELLSLMRCFKVSSGCFIALVGNRNSTIAQFADYCLSTGAVKEACHLGLAPTTSTTVSLVLGDALAICAAEARGFSKNDFAKSHPSGRLGQLLTLRVADVMTAKKDCAIVAADDNVLSSILAMAECRQSVSLVEKEGEIIGVQPVFLSSQAKMLHSDLSMVSNSQYVLPLDLRLDASLILQDALSLLQTASARYQVVFDGDEFVGLFDAVQWGT